ncbi:DUF3656 domain-containing protein, partial [bacterium]|nr:DUF3656 domain-containing protein [bacterium]
VIFDFQPNPEKSFNRHFTDYFLSGQQQEMASHQTPKSMGEYLGRVGRITARGFTLNTQTPVHTGDGLCFLDTSGELQGMRINQLEKNMIIPAEKKHLSNDVAIYRNHDHEFIKTLERSKTGRKITVDLILQETENGFKLSGTDSDGCTAMGTRTAVKIPADNPEKSRQTLEQQLGKMGGSDFELGSLVLNFSQAWFLPRSEINTLRRNLLEKLAAVREQGYNRSETQIHPNTEPYPETKLGFNGNVLNQKAAKFYQRHGVKVVELAAESGLDLQNRTVMTTRYCLKKELDWCPRESVKTPAMQEPLYLVDEAGRRIRLEFNCSGTCGMRLILEK